VKFKIAYGDGSPDLAHHTLETFVYEERAEEK